MAAPAFADIAVAENSVGINRAISSPASTKVGQWMLVQVLVQGVGLTITMPEDWIKLGQVEIPEGASLGTGAWFGKIATKNGPEEANVSWGVLGLTNSALVSTYESFDNATPVIASAFTENTALTTSMIFGSVTPGQKETLSILAGLVSKPGLANSGASPEGYTERSDITSTVAPYLATRELAEGTATGEKTVTLVKGRAYVAAHFILASEPKEEKELIEQEELLQRIAKLAKPPQVTVVAIAEGGRGRGFDLTDEIEGLTFSNVNPGGDEVCSFTLSRSWFAENPEIDKGNLLRVLYGVDVLWQGRVEEIDRGTGDSETLLVTCYGLGNRLGDLTFREIYIDRDNSKWVDRSIQRRIDQASLVANVLASSGFQDTGSAGPGLVFTFTTAQSGTTNIGELWYYGQGIDLGALSYSFRSLGGAGADASFSDQGFLSTDDLATSFDSGTNHQQTNAENQTFVASVAGRKYALFQVRYAAGSSFTFTSNVHGWLFPRVTGRHGIIAKGSAPTEGFSADQIVVHIVSKATGIMPRTISSFSYIIQQLTFETAISPKDAIPTVDEFAGADYGTWGPSSPFDNSTNGYFDYTQKQPEVQHWFATRADFDDDLNFHTETQSLYDTVDVNYTDEGGINRTERFSITSPDLMEAGLSPRVYTLVAGTTTKAGARAFGEIFLSLFAGFAPARGSGTLSKPIRHYRRGLLSPCYLRADGANVRIPDILPAETTFSLDATPDRRTTFPIKRVTVDCSGEVPKANIEFDQANDSLAVLLAQEAAQAALVG